jgi:iron complex transport system substrate-binding protein
VEDDVMFRQRRVRSFLTLWGAVLASLALACGDDKPSEGGSSGAASGTATPSAAAASAAASPAAALRLLPLSPADLGAPKVPDAAKSAMTGAQPYEPAVAPYARYGSDAAPGVFPRTVCHAMGETAIKAAPQRVVVLDTGELDAVVELGITPVATLDYSRSGLAPYLTDVLKGVATVGSLEEPNLEAIAAARPDLILSNSIRHEKIYDKLSAIAPTVFGARAGLVWRHNFALYAGALGREQRAAETIRQYEERVKKLNAALPNPRPTISVIRVVDTNLRYYQRANFIGIILTDLGFPRPGPQNVDDFALLNQSLETVGQYGPADVIAVAIWPNEENPFGKTLLESPLWKGLLAVQQGKVLVANDRTWIAGLGYRAAHSVMDDLEKFFGVKP